MASLSIPIPSGRPDLGRTGDRGSTFRGVNRGRGGATRGDRGRGGRGGRRGGTSTRGGRSHGSSPLTEDSPNTPVSKQTQSSTVPPQPSRSTTTASKNSSSSSLPQSPPVDLPAKPKTGTRRATPQRAADKVPSLTIEPASPTVNSPGSAPPSASTTSSNLSMSTRRRRSHNKSSGAALSAESLTVEALASAMKARKSRSGPSSPHQKDSPSKAKTNIDSLVEHVRALAMDHNRPSTPGSHIDWAGDEDDSLPDLDDWGVAPSSHPSADANPLVPESIEKSQNFDKTTPSPSVGSQSLSPNIANAAPVLEVNGLEDGHGEGVGEASPSPVDVERSDDPSPGLSEPSPRPSLASAPADPQPPLPPEPAPTLDAEHPEDAPEHPSSPISEPPLLPTASATPPAQPETQNSADSTHAPPYAEPAPPEAELAFDTSERGLATSIHAPKSSPTEPVGTPEGPPPAAGLPPAAAPRNATHGRSRTLGRGPPFAAGAKRGFLPSAPTGVGVDARGLHHSRTQSTPTSTAASHRRQHSRPIITMDAMSRIAKSLGTALPRREVAAAATK
ncbi:hypothetical protein BJV78DRAFT_775671 [Lactifluus subvellereus]|nr:hypothetical protein BJV78DRAFT_775671 [Lactifluus subvellereus]